MMKDPRICVVGAGNLSTRRIYPYLGAAGAQLVGVCDLETEKAETNARRFGGKAYNNLEDMLAGQRPDGVIVCIGPSHHASLAGQILQLGYPVYTEKPSAPTSDEVYQVALLAKEKGLLCTTAFKKRYTTAANRATQWLAQFPAQDRLSISIDYCSGPYQNKNPLHTFLLDFAVHIIDLTQYLFGDVESVFTFSKEGHAYAVSLRFTCEAIGTMNLADGRSFSVPTEEIEITLQGGNFMTISNSSNWRITENNKCCEWRHPPTFTSVGDSGYDTGHLAELEDFVAALRENRITTRSSIYESYKTMVLYEAIKTSAETGEVVRPVYQTL